MHSDTRHIQKRIFDDKEFGNNAIRATSWKSIRVCLIKLDSDMDMEEDKLSNATIKKMSKTSYKES